MKKLLILTVMFLFSVASIAKDIKGRVVDDSGNPLEFVNVLLMKDSSFVAGVISDGDGRFNFSSGTGDATKLKLSFIGYETQLLNITANGDMGTVKMMPASTELKGIVVKGIASSTHLKGNTLITNVENGILAHAGTAKDVLAKVPMLIDNGGNIEVFGKGSPLIYINDRRINDPQELTQLLSDNIHDVKVITNPGASFSADAKAVVRIRTKRPQDDGWSGSFRSANSVQHYFKSANTADLKYRSGGLEVFTNWTYNAGKNWENKTTDITTKAVDLWQQHLATRLAKHYNGLLGKAGFSWMINKNHSIGGYYQDEYSKIKNISDLNSNVFNNGTFYDTWTTSAENTIRNNPRHAANIYYNGQFNKLSIDFNADYLWNKTEQNSSNNEISKMRNNQQVTTCSDNKSDMLAEKLMLTYPILKGVVKSGEEYVSSKTNNHFFTEYSDLDNASSNVREKNTAVFVEVMQQLGKFNLGAGLRYEHVNYEYFEGNNSKFNLSKSYDNIFSSLNVSTILGKVQMSLSYSGRVERPSYSNLNANVSYVNRMTYESGNPRLQPTKIHSIEYITMWKKFFAQVSYAYFDNPIVSTTKPYNEDGRITILTSENFTKKHFLQAFIGGQFQAGAWQPRVNAGILKQWFSMPVDGNNISLNKPIAILQWQNAIHLPFDTWFNIDCQWMSSGNDRNIYVTSSSYINTKLYKDFFKKRLSFTLEARDIFNTSRQNVNLYNNAVTIFQKDFSDMRCVTFTIQYNFNMTRDRYRGTGAGNSEKRRF